MANYTAKLVNGQTYVLKNRKFVKGEEQVVDQETKDLLERDAVIVLTVSGDGEPTAMNKSQFVFKEIAPAKAEAKADAKGKGKEPKEEVPAQEGIVEFNP